MISGYYLPRWQKFYAMLQQHLDQGTEYNEDGLPQVYGREAFRANEFYTQLADWELSFVNRPNKARTPVTEGDELKIVRELFAKYSQLAEEYYAEDIKADEIKKEKTYENLGEK